MKKFQYSLEFDGEISKLQSKLKTIQDSFGKLGNGENGKGIQKTLDDVGKSLSRLQEKANSPIISEATFGGLLKDSGAITAKLKELGGLLDKIAGLSDEERFEFLSPETQKRIKSVTEAMKGYEDALNATIKKTDEHIKKEKELSDITREKINLENSLSKNKKILKTATDTVNATNEEIAAIKERMAALGEEEELRKRVNGAREAAAKIAKGETVEGYSTETIAQIEATWEAYQKEVKELEKKNEALKIAASTQEKYSKTVGKEELQLKGITEQYETLTAQVNKFERAMKSSSTKNKNNAWKELRNTAESLGVSMEGIPLKRTEEGSKELLSRLEALKQQGFAELTVEIDNTKKAIKEMNDSNNSTADRIRQENELYSEQKKIMSDREAFVQRIKDFIGLQGAANLARRAIGDAVEAIRELDSVMTEMAMVTEADIGDYWEQMEDHTERANRLGVAIKEVYEAETLYYQQGLKAAEVTAMSGETLKMARIANLSAADATDKMTAALRGFNMELNDTSAQRVADVYSELAAITAADVNDISSAMSKTASIASSAGMEFETTAAFLSQIIETTQESAETAGTALKTVIARFQELKKDPSEIGEVDGEIVDANAIEGALRSVGVSLRDTSGQFRDLDDVFLELAEKWNTLDKNTQRYIATIAAGSRQQSRFIAMMSDYGRTQELVSAANSSAGASNEQFEKTLESLESKLEKLHNAWTTFTTGLLNQDILKFGIEVLTQILEFINKLTKGFGGLTGTISKLGLLFGAFKLGQKLLSKFANNFVNTFRRAGTEAGNALVESWRRGLGQIENEAEQSANDIGKDKSKKPADYSSKSKIAEDGHIKGFREFQVADFARKKANKRVRTSTATAINQAETGSRLSTVVENQTIDKGLLVGKKGKNLGHQGFTEAFDKKTISSIEAQFKDSIVSMTNDISKAEEAWKSFENEMNSLDALDGLNQLDSKLTEIANSAGEGVEKITHISVTKDMQDAVLSGANARTTATQVRASTSTAIKGAEPDTSLKDAISGQQVGEGMKKGQDLSAQSFTTTFGPNTIKAIETQFVTSVTNMTGNADQAKQAWKEFEDEMSSLDATSGLAQLDAKLASVAATATDAKTKVTSISASSAIATAASQDAKKTPVVQRVGEAIAESTPVTAAQQTSGLKKANKAIAGAKGKSTKETLSTKNISVKLDNKTLQAVEKQFRQKMTSMGASIETINQAWTELEQNIGDKDAVAALGAIDAKLATTAQNLRDQGTEVAEGMDEITNSSEIAGAAGEDALEAQSTTLESVGETASAVGGGLMGVGAAFGFIGEMFRSMGLDAVADAFDTVAQVIMFVGGALMLIPPIISIINLALSTPPIGIIMLIIGAIVIGLTLIIALISSIAKSNSTAEQLNKASEAADEAKENAAAAKEKFEELLETKDAYDGLVKTIKNLTEGTRAWKQAIAELNTLVTELILKYPQLAQFTNWDKGYLDVSAEGWDYILEQQAQVVSNAAAIAAKRQKEVQSFKKKTAKEDVTKATNTLVNKNNEYKDQVEVINALVETGKYGTEEYYQKINKLQKAISSDNIAGAQEAFNTYTRELGEYNHEIENFSKAELEILRHTGSAKAQASKNYNNIIQSLEGQYSTIHSAASTQVMKDTSGLYTESNDGTNDKLKEMLKKEGLSSSGDEKLDMADLLEAKTGEVVTNEDITEMDKDADNKLAEKVREAYTVEAMGETVDEIYELTLDNQKVADLYSGDLDVNLISDDEINALENTTDVVKNALRKQKEAIENGRKEIDLELTKLYGELQKNGTKKEVNATAFFGSYKAAKKSIEQMQAILRGPGADVVASYQELMQGMSVKDRNEFVDYFEDVNWNSAIEGAKALKEASQNASGEIAIFGQSTLELASSFYSATSQANEFYRSLNTEALDELMEDGNISALEIRELAEANEDLATMLENTGASAATLGRYYELLEEGTLTAASATGDFLRVLEKLNGAANTIEDSFAFLDTWEPSRSSTEISDSFSDMRDEMLELYNSGAFGDQALQDYIETFIGKENWERVLEENEGDISDAMKQVMERVKSFEGDFKATWQSLAESGSITGLSQGEDGSILFNFEEMADVETLKQQIMDQGWSEEMADALIADAQTFGEKVKEGLKGTDIDEAFTEWLETSVISSGGVKVLDKGQFDAFMKESDMDAGTVEKLLKDYGIEVGKALDDQGNLQAWIKEAILTDVKENNKFDLGATYDLLVSMGLTTDEAESQIAALAEEMQDVEFTLDGQTVKQAGESLTEMTYDSNKFGSTAGLLEASRNKKVKLEQKKAALEQGRVTAEAMTIANVSAANIGAKQMAANMDAIANFFGIKTSFLESAEKDTQDQINTALESVEISFQSIEEDLNKEMEAFSKTESDVDAEGILNAYKESDAAKSTPTTGVAYGGADQVTKDSKKPDLEYDWIFNYNEQINRLLRERNKIEREYTRLLEDQNSSAEEILQKSREELGNLQEKADYEMAAIGRSYTEIENIFADKANEKYTKLMKYDAGTNTFTVDEGLAAQNFSEEEMETFNQIAADVTKYRDIITDSEDSLSDIEDSVKEIKNRGKDETSELYDVIYEGMIKERQEEIDKLQDINDTIQQAEDKLLSKIQEQIDDARQAREEEKAKEALGDQQSYLTYLQGTSSGSNQLEAAQLEKDIEQSKQDLMDAKIDQSLANISEANAQAAEQRQRQIDIAQQQLDLYSTSALIWEDVQNVLYSSLVDAQASEDFATAWSQTEAALYWASVKEDGSLNPIAAADMASEFATNGKMAAIWTGIASLSSEEANNLRSNGVAAAQNIESYIAGTKKEGPLKDAADSLLTDLSGKEGAIDETKKAIGTLGNTLIGADSKENILGNASANASAIVGAINNLKPALTPSPNATNSTNTSGGSGGSGSRSSGGSTYSGKSSGKTTNTSTTNTKIGNGVEIASNASWVASDWSIEDLKDDDNESGYITVGGTNYYVKAMGDNSSTVAGYGYDLGATAGQVLRYKGVYYLYVDSTTARQLGKSDDWLFKTNSLQEGYNKFTKALAFKTGGLADFTGPAWLDGTKSHPELVLNAQDTQNFIQLKDILSDILNGSHSINSNNNSQQNSAVNSFDIDINVEKIGDDYDVEAMADKIRSMLYDDATYRNVNNINRTR